MVLKNELSALLALSSVHCIIQSADVLNDVHGSVNQRPAYIEKIFHLSRQNLNSWAQWLFWDSVYSSLKNLARYYKSLWKIFYKGSYLTF